MSCSDYTPGTCGYCFCMGKDYLCNGTCSDVDQKGPGGVSICIACSPTSGGSTVGGGTTGGGITTPPVSGGSTPVGGGGSASALQCNQLTMDECEYKLCIDPNYCSNSAGSGGMDQRCCQTDKTEGSATGGVTKPTF